MANQNGQPEPSDPSEPSRAGVLFEQFVADIIREMPGFAQATVDREGERGVDLVIDRGDGSVSIVETKAYTPSTPQRIEGLAKYLAAVKDALGEPSSQARYIIAVPGVIGPDLARKFAQYGIEIWDGPQLSDAATRAGVELPKVPRIARRPRDSPRGEALIERLANIPPGGAGWVAYQKWCTDALEYLFCPPLEVPRTENANESGVNRRDIVMANYTRDGFWAFMRQHYGADFIVVDAKNHTDLIKKTEILQVANYLNAHGLGLFGLVVTRAGEHESATVTIREQWIMHRKLLVVLNDEEMRQMLLARDGGVEPHAVLRQKIEDFRLSI